MRWADGQIWIAGGPKVQREPATTLSANFSARRPFLRDTRTTANHSGQPRGSRVWRARLGLDSCRNRLRSRRYRESRSCRHRIWLHPCAHYERRSRISLISTASAASSPSSRSTTGHHALYQQPTLLHHHRHSFARCCLGPHSFTHPPTPSEQRLSIPRVVTRQSPDV